MLRHIDNDTQYCRWVIVASIATIDPRVPRKSIVQQTNCACQRGLKIQTTTERLSDFFIIRIVDGVGVDIHILKEATSRQYYLAEVCDFVFSMIGAGLDSSASGDGINGGIRGAS
eukprot:scaffold1327_cov65-Cyclotella_meneghiniana.AAC.1